MKSFLVVFLLLVGNLGFTSAWAQSSGPVESKLDARKVVTKDGKEQFEPATSARPGDVIEYIATYTNKGATDVSNLEATLPIPANTEIILSSIQPLGATASTGGSQFQTIPLRRKVRLPNGSEQDQDVPPREYRSLRWAVGSLAAGSAIKVSARVKVIDDRAAAAR